ncbi:Magnesium transport protein CorA [Cytospora mali]|uniref:Magnesium transport protein CorA n=1 Tax=Cytospora mali TaxID=578113 RepID=A0A194VGR4_CYTMA|nr:Magnesium transport protein CorA [Valsa mali var. pyri (nom. inval.)]
MSQPEHDPSTTSQDSAVPSAPITTSVSDTPAVTGASPTATPTRPVHPHVHYDLALDTGVGPTSGGPVSSPHAITESDTELPRNRAMTNTESPVHRRITRANTFKSIEDFSDFDHREGWHPGAEPGVDPYKTDGGRASLPKLSAPCDITVIDFSQDDLHVSALNNDDLAPFLKEPQPKWAKCRWINVNGLSWDVISTLGQYKKLHKLSIEDIMNTRNRTKTDWYANHAFIVFTMLKLSHVTDDDSSDSDLDSESDTRSHSTERSRLSRKSSQFTKPISDTLRSMIGRTRSGQRTVSTEKALETGNGSHHNLKTFDTDLSMASGEALERTVQRYNAGPNKARVEFMEKHAALAGRNLAVIAEQVSIFITNDNTIISFFELSADMVEKPILTRLYTQDTVLRQSCDASMVGQAIIDAVIDMAMPVASVYGDVIGDLELDILTRPDITHTKKLYIIICELNKILSFINPILNLINALRDHRTELSQESATMHLQDASEGIIITPMAYTYLGDVFDHSVLIQESLNAVKAQADGLISLLFNTIAVYQNESMKQLTLATIFFLPLTFLTGYFGQNFQPFTDLNRGIKYFWMIAAPMSFVTILVLMRDAMIDYVKAFFARRSILRARKHRRERSKKRR